MRFAARSQLHLSHVPWLGGGGKKGGNKVLVSMDVVIMWRRGGKKGGKRLNEPKGRAFFPYTRPLSGGQRAIRLEENDARTIHLVVSRMKPDAKLLAAAVSIPPAVRTRALFEAVAVQAPQPVGGRPAPLVLASSPASRAIAPGSARCGDGGLSQAGRGPAPRRAEAWEAKAAEAEEVVDAKGKRRRQGAVWEAEGSPELRPPVSGGSESCGPGACSKKKARPGSIKNRHGLVSGAKRPNWHGSVT